MHKKILLVVMFILIGAMFSGCYGNSSGVTNSPIEVKNVVETKSDNNTVIKKNDNLKASQLSSDNPVKTTAIPKETVSKQTDNQNQEYERVMKITPREIIKINGVKEFEKFISNFRKFGNPPTKEQFKLEQAEDMAMNFIELYFDDSTQNEYKPNLYSYVIGKGRNKIEKEKDGFNYGIKDIAAIVGSVSNSLKTSDPSVEIAILRRTESYFERQGKEPTYDVFKEIWKIEFEVDKDGFIKVTDFNIEE